MAGLVGSLLNIVAPKKKLRAGGTTATPTFNPQQSDQVLTLPQYQDHLSDLFTTRQASNSQDLLKLLAQQDPDVSSAINGYLTLANTDMIVWAEDIEGNVDTATSAQVRQILDRLSYQTDYTLGFQLKLSISQLIAEQRYMVLLRGALGGELIYDKTNQPAEMRQVDMASIRWYEKQAGAYKPGQVTPGKSDPVMLDIPNFFVSFYRRDPTAIYTNSPFVSVINTVAARQQVVNDLYRIMRFTGYPRMEIKVIEEVLIKNCPANVKADPKQLSDWTNQRIQEITSAFADIRADQSVVHTDAVEVTILNNKGNGGAINITEVIQLLNSQNQAALKTMATILGRGSAGVNTGSVEARLAAMFADELNGPIADFWSRALSFILHQTGFQGFVRVEFRNAELRPDTELEPQLTLKAARLRQDLSDGIISDADYTLEMYGRLPYPGAPPLSGTGFAAPAPAADPADVSANTDPLGRSISPDKTKQTKANPKKTAPPAASKSQKMAQLALSMLALEGEEAED